MTRKGLSFQLSSVIPAHAGIYLFLLIAESRPLKAKYQIPELRWRFVRNDKDWMLRSVRNDTALPFGVCVMGYKSCENQLQTRSLPDPFSYQTHNQVCLICF
jgi:hypothetical protein